MTKRHSMVCRVCGNEDVQALPLGAYAAFFRLRVNIRNDKYLLYSKVPLLGGSEISIFSKVLKRLGKIFGSAKDDRPWAFRTMIQYCTVCQSITPVHEWQFEDLQGLYRDYRSETYNRDRISVEASYASIAKHVGEHPAEVANRNAAADAFLRKNASSLAGTMMLDFGGSDGRFLPSILLEHYETLHIYDPSGAPLHPSVDRNKVSKISMVDGSYDFVACMHVLEHVGNPRAFLADALAHVRGGGVMYIEFPIDMTEEWRSTFKRRVIDNALLLHEHINLFSMDSVPALAASLGAEMIDASLDVVDCGWTTAQNGRFLIRKRG